MAEPTDIHVALDQLATAATLSVASDGATTESLYNLILTTVPSLHKLASGPVPMLLWCPTCNARHIDKGEFSTKPHHTHACQNCGMTWRPAVVHTVGVQYLPGFKDP
jgi:predicted RNA-binding Zn-ribbon protein involved in translation (DUF1610 family)